MYDFMKKQLELFRKSNLVYVTEVNFEEKLSIEIYGNTEILNSRISPLEEICTSNNFKLTNYEKFDDKNGKVSVFSDYLKVEKIKQSFFKTAKNPVIIKNHVCLYTGKKSSTIFFAEGKEDNSLISEFQKYYSTKPEKRLRDSRDGGYVSDIQGIRISTTIDKINNAFKRAKQKVDEEEKRKKNSSTQ